MMAPGKFRPSQFGGRCSNAMIAVDRLLIQFEGRKFLAIVIASGFSAFSPGTLEGFLDSEGP